MVEDQIKKEFDAIDKKDPNKLHEFFHKYSCFKLVDLSIIVDISQTVLRELRARADLRPGGGGDVKFIDYDIPRYPDEFEDTPEWWKKNYPAFGTTALTRASGLNQNTVIKRINKYHGSRIPLKEASKSKHPCCNKEWLEEHYVNRGLSLARCAITAGVSDDAIRNWLIRFEIPQRHITHGPIVDKSRRKQTVRDKHSKRHKDIS